MTAPRDVARPEDLPGGSDTIVAEATPPGRGALSLIRVSGPRAFQICSALADRWPSHPRHATLTPFRDGMGTVLDQVLLTRFDCPRSFTGEALVEMTVHGGAVVAPTIVGAIVERGARLALPGEFTRRALLNGKLDLLQAEATGDLVAATSRAAQRAALDQLDGGLTRRIAGLRRQLLHLEALLAYDIDFPEEDDGPIPRERIASASAEVVAGLAALAGTGRAGELIRDGALVVIAGAPNAGKSSLFNAVIGQRRAIVTEIPGTTRDALEAVIDTGRWPLRLVDTAGLRETTDRVEQMGIDIARDYIERAAVVLVCADTGFGLRATATSVRAASPSPIVLTVTKTDLGGIPVCDLAAIGQEVEAAGVVSTSAERGTGIQELTDLIVALLDSAVGSPDTHTPILTRARHQHIVVRAEAEVQAFRRALAEEIVPISIAAVHLRAALAALEDLVGVVDVDQILDEVFSRFCVGK